MTKGLTIKSPEKDTDRIPESHTHEPHTHEHHTSEHHTSEHHTSNRYAHDGPGDTLYIQKPKNSGPLEGYEQFKNNDILYNDEDGL